eukprot:TRINITY_DN1334_c0_g1_i3.p1 TRINITY_DN1334_c0_g1~~TRINITY_DN1334_c0_g1_i3.p1  ORF type:complete len:355 (-),score=26.59 TRINITY_DN1334_c0_g1_i3:551-1615(-)
MEYKNFHGAYSVFEPSMHMDKPAQYFKKQLPLAGVRIVLNHKVSQMESFENSVIVDGQQYDWVLNCTNYQDFTVSKLFGAELFYQPILTLLYEDLNAKEERPSSFTVMDGWFFCLLPMVTTNAKRVILYHAKYTILGSYRSVQEVQEVLDSLSKEWVEKDFKEKVVKDVLRFLPNFEKRFKYIGYTCGIATKLRSKQEFRSALVWADERVIHVFPGKVNNICQAWEEVNNIILLSSERSSPSTKVVPLNGIDGKMVVAGDSVYRAWEELQSQGKIEGDCCSLTMTQEERNKMNKMKSISKEFGKRANKSYTQNNIHNYYNTRISIGISQFVQKYSNQVVVYLRKYIPLFVKREV